MTLPPVCINASCPRLQVCHNRKYTNPNMASQVPQHLPRGRACVPCRRRKMKCDGNQPTCNQCMRFDRAAECQFVEGPSPSTARVLEQHISRLQSRIHELEQDDPNLVRLRNPYENVPAASSSGGNTAVAPHAAQPNWWETSDPPTQMQQTLVQYFLREAPKFGFFLDARRLLTAFAKPTATRPRPPSVIRNAIYLWGINLSRNPQYTAREPLFLGRALRSVHVALSSAHEQQQNTLYVLQAEVLLAYYFFHCDRLLEGKFHASAAVSLAIMCNLHQINAPQGGGFQSAGQAFLPPPADPVDEAERIYAWWTTFVLDKSWVVALSAPAMISETQEPGTVIHTPWPLTVDEYAQQPASARPNAGSTVQRFLADVTADGAASSPLALIAKAAALYERASALAAHTDTNSQCSRSVFTRHRRLTGLLLLLALPSGVGDGASLAETAGYEAALLALDGAVEQLKQALPPLERAGSVAAPADEHATHSLLVLHGLAHAATVQLHRAFAERSATSRARCLASASALVRVVHELTRRLAVVSPLVGVLAATAGEVLVHGLQSMRSARTAWASSAALPGEDKFAQSTNQLVAALERLTQSPFVASQTARLREAAAQ
ncbi:uncharacterized protein PHACADRAFT_188424 [Phanerochaete carnosa HHB-10118-sp]|uniref:Zn(2)-C6 fungal-type domain-containing protein n=1 Tax=Phanerochaete carnosa (strain HHB-10118-sp) TaxID=650164 RepID=K5UKC3_PHACS|nr:uncharacterized protein PHACADRAFT_188424 [Phanerochaete carnosa HHB-10118-sp]EKM50061.1 hypothetical protein PHACADRAFT_188424 [Phanerochaete carnosa HHB-10118-sp]